MSERTVKHFLDDILHAIEDVERFVAQMDFESFAVDEKTVRATEREFEIIGESVKKLPHSLTHEYPEIPWRAIAGMRDRLIHHYWETEKEILWKTVQESIPPLKKVIQELLEKENQR